MSLREIGIDAARQAEAKLIEKEKRVKKVKKGTKILVGCILLSISLYTFAFLFELSKEFVAYPSGVGGYMKHTWTSMPTFFTGLVLDTALILYVMYHVVDVIIGIKPFTECD